MAEVRKHLNGKAGMDDDGAGRTDDGRGGESVPEDRPAGKTRRRRTDEEMLADIERRQAQFAEQARNVKDRIRKRDRARDTRRRILLGSFVLNRIAAGPGRFAELRGVLRDELPGFLKPADRDLFADILDQPQDAGAAPAPTVGEILERLGARRRRCTYGAVAGLLGITPAEVGPLLGDRTPQTSWVVSARTGRPAGYPPERLHPELELNPDVINDPEELRELCRTGG